MQYTWTALYTDGTYLSEHEASQGFASVEQDRVKSLELHALGDFSMHSVSLPDRAQPVFFRRHHTIINVADDSVVNRDPIHCIGWKRGEEAVYLFIFGNGSTLLSNDLQAV